MDCFTVTWESFSFSKRRFLWCYTCMWYLISFSILSNSVPIFSFSLPVIVVLFKYLKELNIYLAILFLLSSCLLLYLIKIYLFLFHTPNRFTINKGKSIYQWWFVCCMSCSEIFLSQCSTGCTKIDFVANHGGNLC